MAPRDGVRRREGVRGRRGVLSIGILSVLLILSAGLPIAAQIGVLPVAAGHEIARSLDLPTVNQSIAINDTSPGYTPDTVVISADENVTFQLQNRGSSAHTFTIVNASNVVVPCSMTTTPAQVYNNLTRDHMVVNATLAPGAYLNWSHTFNASGTFEFLSAIPYQCQVGFNGFIHVLPAGSHSQQFLFTNATGSLTFTPSSFTAQAGIPIYFQVGLEGSLAHTFTLDSVSNDTTVAAGTNLPSSFPTTGGVTSAQFPINLNLVTSGVTYPAPPIILKAGVYWIVCVIPGHFAGGMWAKLYVSIAASLPSSIPSITNVLQYGYLAVVAVILGLGAFLVLMGMNEPVSVKPGETSPPPAPHGH